MRSLGYTYFTDPSLSLPSYFGQNTGLLIFSRIPIISEHSNIFKKKGSITNKGFIEVTLDLSLPSIEEKEKSDGDLHIICTHLDAVRKKLRKQQLLQISKRIEELVVMKATFIILGDFNVPSPSVEYNELLDIFGGSKYYQNALDVKKEGGGTYRSMPKLTKLCLEYLTAGIYRSGIPIEDSQKSNRSLDHTFIRNENKRREVIVKECQILNWLNREKTMPVSDHFGILATIQIQYIHHLNHTNKN